MPDQFCGNCGTRIGQNAKFCKNCGKPTGGSVQPNQSSNIPPPMYSQPQYDQPKNSVNQFSPPPSGPPNYVNNAPYGQNKYGQPQYNQNQYGQPQYNQFGSRPMYGQFNAPPSIAFEPWTETNIVTTTIQLYQEPERVAPSILLTPNGPNSAIIAVVAGLVYASVAYIRDYRLVSALNSNLGHNINVSPASAITNFFEILIGFFIGSLIVHFIMSSGFPYGSLQYRQSYTIFRKVWGYLLFSMILYKLLMIPIILLMTPVLTTQGNTVIVRPSQVYYISNGLLYGIASVVNLITFRKISKSLQNNSSGLTVVSVIWALIIAYNVYAQIRM